MACGPDGSGTCGAGVVEVLRMVRRAKLVGGAKVRGIEVVEGLRLSNVLEWQKGREPLTDGRGYVREQARARPVGMHNGAGWRQRPVGHGRPTRPASHARPLDGSSLNHRDRQHRYDRSNGSRPSTYPWLGPTYPWDLSLGRTSLTGLGTNFARFRLIFLTLIRDKTS